MNEKRLNRMDFVKVIVGLLVLIMLGMFFVGFRIAVGRCLVAEVGDKGKREYLFIEGTNPTVMRENPERYEHLQTGDKLLVVMLGAQTASYPNYGGVRYIMRIGSGTIEDISQEVLNEMANLGWTYIN